ncbi:MAG: 50S ribosomal protein L34e [Promethearchaeota archaeon]
MPRPAYRSKAMARKKLRTPGNRNVIHYWRRKPKIAHCAKCKRPIPSIPRLRPSKMKKTLRTKRRANRMESGRYCAVCLRELIQEQIWNQNL